MKSRPAFGLNSLREDEEEVSLFVLNSANPVSRNVYLMGVYGCDGSGSRLLLCIRSLFNFLSLFFDQKKEEENTMCVFFF